MNYIIIVVLGGALEIYLDETDKLESRLGYYLLGFAVGVAACTVSLF